MSSGTDVVNKQIARVRGWLWSISELCWEAVLLYNDDMTVHDSKTSRPEGKGNN